jgi:hypothetical protein
MYKKYWAAITFIAGAGLSGLGFDLGVVSITFLGFGLLFLGIRLDDNNRR